MRCFGWLGFLFCVSAVALSGAEARPIDPDEIPPPLRPWVDWVLHDAEEATCPQLYNGDQHHCAWPSPLALDLNEAGGELRQSWQVHRRSWVELPGEPAHWPQGVTVDGEPALLTERDGRPAVELASGTHHLRGHFQWHALPETLLLPPSTGLVELRVGGQEVPFPELSEEGRLWLRQRGQAPTAGDGDRLVVRVFRRVVDEIPLQVETHVELEVSGSQREEVLGTALLPGFIPLRLTSPIPARLEVDGRLQVQVRPGHWVLQLAARHPAELDAVGLPPSTPPWPAEEVWAFDARNHLRLVEIEGVDRVEPRQTSLPPEWQGLPAFRLTAGETMTLKVVRRGDPDPEPDRLSLQRDLWLDFDGGGYTFNDRVHGTMTRGWRLEAAPAIALGRVMVDGQPQLITTLQGSDKAGVEVRRGTIDLVADGRYGGDVATVPAVGWDHDFQQVAATLHLPPGWRLLAATGVDDVPDTWIARWTLLDLFVVLIATLAISRLWGWPWGVLALATLALIWHEPGAPRYVWLNVLAAIALLRVLPAGRMAFLVRLYRNLGLVALVVLALPFLVEQVRDGIYPQLAQPQPVVSRPPAVPAPARVSRQVAKEAGQVLGEVARPMKSLQYESYGARAPAELVQVDPKALIQTGPGLPSWQWRATPLVWHGPVERGQSVHLILLSPATNLLLNLVRVGLLAALAIPFLRSVRPIRPVPVATAAAALWLVAMTGVGVAQADDFPSPEMLAELKARLLEPAECLPACAQIPRLRLEVTADRLQGRLEVHALADTALPLPVDVRGWVPQAVTVDGDHPAHLVRDDRGGLWVYVDTGHHQIAFAGRLPARDTVDLPLPLLPRRVEAQVEGWHLEGLHDDGVADGQLKLTRLRGATTQEELAPLVATTLPPFVRVERTIRLDLHWHVETRIVRASPPGAAAVLEVPLLPGESVTTDGVRVADGKVLVNMGADQGEWAWDSSLEQVPDLRLRAPDATGWTEVWRVDVSPIWHAEMDGIPVVHHVDRGGRWLPEWRPWPGEEVHLAISRPEGVAGQTLTIDRSHLEIAPGERATDATLTVALRSSQGGQHTLTLPADAVLQSVTIDGRPQPIRQEGRAVTLPVTPGAQSAVLTWRSPAGGRALLTTPEVDLGTASVNHSLTTTLGRDRWVLFTLGPRLGPAVLFWGVLLVVLLVAVGLGRLPYVPLKGWQWFLLGIGLSQSPPWVAVIVVGWLFALAARARLPADLGKRRFNAVQVGLVLLSLAALVNLFEAIQTGLLGLPAMQIAGNGSSAYHLAWYRDRAAAVLPQARVLSVPLLAYRLLMLGWALWLAFALLGWLRWGWRCFATGGVWREVEIPLVKGRRKRESPAEE